MKLEMFHTFYQHIEEIQSTVIQEQPIIVENLNVRKKSGNNLESVANDRMCNVDNDNDTIVGTIDVKYDHHFNENVWHDVIHASSSERMF